MKLLFDFDIAPREALAAPTKTDQTRTQSLVILLVSIVSALGAGWIMLSFLCFKSLRSFRHQLILGLAFSDLVMALNFLSSSAMDIGGRYIGDPAQTQFCSFNGWMTQVFVIQTDYWVLTIAICTYFILADHKIASSWVQDHRWLLFGLPWFLSILWASVGLGVAGYGNIGAWCWFTSDEVRLLVNFVPRWIIIVLMLAMYARLYLVLFRAHNRFVSFDNSSSMNPSSGTRSRNITVNHTGPRLGHHDGEHGNEAEVSAQGSQPYRINRRLKKLARLMLMYPFAYMLVWTLPTSIRIYQVATGKPAPFVLQTIDKACIVIQGFVDAVIYGVNESSLSSWRNLIWPTTFPTLTGTNVSAGRGTCFFPDQKGSRIPSARLSDHTRMDGASASSLDITTTPTNDSSAHITSQRKDGIELRELRRTEPNSATGDIGAGIRKTVEVEVVSSSASRTQHVGFFRD